jgi:hypothetical protein
MSTDGRDGGGELQNNSSTNTKVIQPLCIHTCKAVIFSVVCLSSAGLKDIWILSAAAGAFFLRLLRLSTVYGAIDGHGSDEWEAVQFSYDSLIPG